MPAGGTQSVAEAIAGLSPGTTYHYRLRADNANGTWMVEDRIFASSSPP
jgi:hypothetical protein